MRGVIQRVKQAKVTVDGEIIGEIGHGILLLLAIWKEDKKNDLNYILDKTINLRIFEDVNKKLNRSLVECQGELLVVSQFTLYGDCKKGRRPSYFESAPPEKANAMYLRFIEMAKEAGIKTAYGKFAAMMEVELINDGPVTLIIDSQKTI